MKWNCCKGVFSLLLLWNLGACTHISAPPVEEIEEYTPTEIILSTVPTLDFTLPYYPDDSLHPCLVVNQCNGDLSDLLYEGLFRLDSQYEPQPWLVDSVEQSGKTWTFTLKEGICFWDGTALTGQMVVWAWNEAKSAESRYSTRFENIASYSAQDLQITVQLKSENYLLPSLLDIPISYGGGDIPQGTGPYCYEPGASSLQRNPLWWGAGVLPQEIALFPIQDKGDLISAFDAGNISILRGNLTGEQSLNFAGNYQVWDYASSHMLYLGFHSTGVNSSLRGLISSAIDRENLISQSLAGYGVATDQPMHPETKVGQWLEDWQYDPISVALAVEEISRLPSSLSLLVNGENLEKTQIAQEIALMLGEFGLVLEVKALPWGEYLSALEQGDFDLYLGEIYLATDFDISPLFFSKGIYNYGNFYSWQLEWLWQVYREEGISALGEENQFFQEFAQEMPFAPLCFLDGTALSLWGHLSQASPTASHLFYDLDQWVIVTE